MGTLEAMSSRIVLFDLESALSDELIAALLRTPQVKEVTRPVAGHQADLVFCPVSPGSLAQARKLYPGTPVVVVSRLPEVQGWLDALEAGAADYCAAPFETVQISWILKAHLTQNKVIAAAA